MKCFRESISSNTSASFNPRHLLHQYLGPLRKSIFGMCSSTETNNGISKLCLWHLEPHNSCINLHVLYSYLTNKTRKQLLVTIARYHVTINYYILKLFHITQFMLCSKIKTSYVFTERQIIHFVFKHVLVDIHPFDEIRHST